VLEVYHDDTHASLKKGTSTLMSSSEAIMQATRKGSLQKEKYDIDEMLI
jgi:hypothetical protein